MGMNVNLTPELEELVRRKVASGLYSSANEVVHEALRLMEQRDQVRAVRLEQLRADIREGLDSGSSEPWDAETVKRQDERALAMARLVGQVQKIVAESGRPAGFNAARWTAQWLQEPNAALGGRTPGEFMDTADGRAFVSGLVGQMQAGTYA